MWLLYLFLILWSSVSFGQVSPTQCFCPGTCSAPEAKVLPERCHRHLQLPPASSLCQQVWGSVCPRRSPEDSEVIVAKKSLLAFYQQMTEANSIEEIADFLINVDNANLQQDLALLQRVQTHLNDPSNPRLPENATVENIDERRLVQEISNLLLATANSQVNYDDSLGQMLEKLSFAYKPLEDRRQEALEALQALRTLQRRP